MQGNTNLNSELDNCFYKLEQLSCKIADNISIGNFGEVTKLDLARKVILHKISKDAAIEIAGRSRGTPRIANGLLRRIRDFAQIKGDGKIDLKITQYGLKALQVDAF